MEKVQLSLTKYYQTIGEPRTQDLINEYRTIFPDLASKETLAENKNFCVNFLVYLKKA